MRRDELTQFRIARSSCTSRRFMHGSQHSLICLTIDDAFQNLESKEDTEMLLTRHLTDNGVRWASNGMLLTPFFSLSAFLGVSRENGIRMVEAHLTDSPAERLSARSRSMIRKKCGPAGSRIFAAGKPARKNPNPPTFTRKCMMRNDRSFFSKSAGGGWSDTAAASECGETVHGTFLNLK